MTGLVEHMTADDVALLSRRILITNRVLHATLVTS